MPTTSPANASSASARSWAKKKCGVRRLIGLPVRTCLTFMPRVSRPEQIRANAMRARRRRERAQAVEQVADAEVLQRRAEINRSQMSLAERREIELAAGVAHER